MMCVYGDRCFVALQNIKSHHAFPNDVKIECPIVLVFNDQDGPLLMWLRKTMYRISRGFSEGTLKVTTQSVP